jgi:hypothetical protein
VAAKAQCDGAVTLIGEEVQKMLVPDRFSDDQEPPGFITKKTGRRAAR